MRKSIVAITLSSPCQQQQAPSPRISPDTIKAIDIKRDAITLDNGRRVHLAEQDEVETMKVGERVAG